MTIFIKTTRKSVRPGGRLIMALIPLLSLLVVLPAATASPLQLDPNMERTWKRTDQFVADNSLSRSWMWGPTNFALTTEEYDGTQAGPGVPAGQRLVAYYDKSRMEINNPNGNRNDKYFITNGLLVKELISGQRAFGDNRTKLFLPSNIPVVGDRFQNPKAPTYASLRKFTSLVLGQNSALSRIGETVTSFLDAGGNSLEDLTYGQYKINIAYYDGTFGHNVPNVFWDFMNSQGKVLENGQSVDGPVVDWIFSTGYPLTEPYWTKAKVAGLEKDVMVQCFERRCYSYTPSNPDGFKVEMGNVGQHYYSWRYKQIPQYCNVYPVRGFGKVWSENPGVKERLQCPDYYRSNEVATQVLTQNFEHGKMYLITSQVSIYHLGYNTRTIMVLFDDGTWASIPDNYDSSQPANGGLTPPPGLFEPQRDLGNAWRNQTALKIRERLGWATETERAGNGAAQAFTGGVMVYLGTTKEIFVGYTFYDQASIWEIYPDTFVG